MKKAILLLVMAIFLISSASAYTVYFTVDERGSIWGESSGMMFYGNGDRFSGTSTCNVTTYDHLGASIYTFVDPLVYNALGAIWDMSNFYDSYPAIYDNETVNTVVSCFDNGDHASASLNTSWLLSDDAYFLFSFTGDNATYGVDKNVTFQLTPYFGAYASTLWYNFTFSFYDSNASLVYVYNAIEQYSFDHFILSNNLSGPGVINWSSFPGNNETYHINATARRVNAGNTSSMALNTEFGSMNLSVEMPVPVCGDNIIGGTEVCDGTSLNNTNCTNYGFFTGTIACLANCSGYNITLCTNCSNNIIEPLLGEVCDGSQLNGTTCQSLGWLRGTLSCGPTCNAFIQASCSNATGGGGSAFPPETPPPPEIPPVLSVTPLETPLLLNFGGLWAEIQLIWFAFVANPIEGLKLLGPGLQKYTIELILLVVVISLLVIGVLQRNKKKAR